MRKLRAWFAAVVICIAGVVGSVDIIGFGVTWVASADVVQPLFSPPVPDGPAPNWMVADLDSGLVLAESNGYVPTPPASTIKVLLTLTVLDELSPDLPVVPTPEDVAIGGSSAGVEPGLTYTVYQLLEGALLRSGNDAADTLANQIGGKDKAVEKMNAKAIVVGATDTVATTPSGATGVAGPGQTTPHDLVMIFRAALDNPVFGEITAEHSAVIPTPTGETRLDNENSLLRQYPGMLGGKFGFTLPAQRTFVGAANRDGRRLAVALLNSPNIPEFRHQAMALLDWGFALDPQSGVGTLFPPPPGESGPLPPPPPGNASPSAAP